MPRLRARLRTHDSFSRSNLRGTTAFPARAGRPSVARPRVSKRRTHSVPMQPREQRRSLRRRGRRAYPWKAMSEADRVFPRRKELGAQSSHSEQRLVLSARRRSGAVGGRSRVVEVVHVRRSGPRPVEDHPRPAPWSVRAEVWPEGFRAKPASPLPPQDLQPVAPEPTQPTVHVMPMWEPTQQRSAQSEAQPAEQPGGMAAGGSRTPRVPKPRAPKTTGRLFADPFTQDDGGVNCMRCGYLVEPAREKRGLMTCSGCG